VSGQTFSEVCALAHVPYTGTVQSTFENLCFERARTPTRKHERMKTRLCVCVCACVHAQGASTQMHANARKRTHVYTESLCTHTRTHDVYTCVWYSSESTHPCVCFPLSLYTRARTHRERERAHERAFVRAHALRRRNARAHTEMCIWLISCSRTDRLRTRLPLAHMLAWA